MGVPGPNITPDRQMNEGDHGRKDDEGFEPQRCEKLL